MGSILDQLMKALGSIFFDGEIRRLTRIWVTVKRKAIRSVVKILKDDFGVSRISMITGLETSHGFEVLYHFERLNEVQLKELITIKIRVPREDPTVDSIVSVMPGALFYEAELRDLFGIELKGYPTLPRIFMSNDTPTPEYSLQKRSPSSTKSSKINRT